MGHASGRPFGERVEARDAHRGLLECLDSWRDGSTGKYLAELLVVAPVLLLAFLVTVHDLVATTAAFESHAGLVMQLATSSALTEYSGTGPVRWLFL